MFTDIAESLPVGWGYTLFDFYRVRGKDVYVRSISDQVAHVRDVFKRVSEKHPDTTIHFIAHSMGCAVLALSGLRANGQVILLAPPDNFGNGALEDYFKQYPGAVEKPEELVVPRKDGTVTHIPFKFFTEIRDIDPIEVIWQYSSVNMIEIIQTTEDEVIGMTDLSRLTESAHIAQLPADHNFTGKARRQLLDSMGQILST